MGWGAGGVERDCFLGLSVERRGIFGERDGKSCIIRLPFVFLSEGKQQRRERANPNEERRACDFVNISAKPLDHRPSKLNRIRCST